MKRVYILLSLIVFLFFSCSEDNTLYEPQEKENVAVDNTQNEDKDEEEELPEGQLLPGMHTVKLNVTEPDGQVVERRFKYYMPIAAHGNPSLIFEFHGSYEFVQSGAIPDPLKDFTISNALVQLAIQENCIICVPVGLVPETERDTAYINWTESEKHLPFFDAMVNYFKGCTPIIDENRIFSTGQSSGAIFSWVLAFERSDIVASIAPRAGQMNTDNQSNFPTRCVPVRVFAGEADKTVQHSAVISNTTNWAERIGGYFANSVAIDTFSIPDYTKVTTRKWNGAKGDIEIYSLEGIGHGVSLSYCCPYMWEFWNSHTLDQTSSSVFVTTDTDTIRTECKEVVKIGLKYTAGATVELTEAPKNWEVTWNANRTEVTLTAPNPEDYYKNVGRGGKIVFTASLNGQEATSEVVYELIEPRVYFKIGDIYYNENSEAVGVVVWVDEEDLQRAKIVSLEEGSVQYAGSGNGLGLDFDTPDKDNGASNTEKMIEKNNTLSSPLSGIYSAFTWANSYTYKGERDWFLPAINELVSLAENLEVVNEAIEKAGGAKVVSPYGSSSTMKYNLFSSTTEVEEGATTKTIYCYNFSDNVILPNKARDAGSEYFGWIKARAFKIVRK